MVWTPGLLQLFDDVKLAITLSPIFARDDPLKPTLLKTDWSAEGMVWISMQPEDNPESVAVTKSLKTGGLVYLIYQKKVHDFNLLVLGLAVVQIWRENSFFSWGSSVWLMGY